jgi:hypothetical protein
MSIPIHSHNIVQAINGDEKAYEQLIEDMMYNSIMPYTIFPCDCEVCKKVTKEQEAEFNKRFQEDLNKRKKEYRDNHPINENIFDDFTMPVLKEYHAKSIFGEVKNVQPMTKETYDELEKIRKEYIDEITKELASIQPIPEKPFLDLLKDNEKINE